MLGTAVFLYFINDFDMGDIVGSFDCFAGSIDYFAGSIDCFAEPAEPVEPVEPSFPWIYR